MARQVMPSGEPIERGPVERRGYRVEGIVQGVGFRPYVHGLALRLGLAGFVANDMRGVRIEVEGATGAVRDFGDRLAADAPPLAEIERVREETLAARGEAGFSIRESRAAGAPETLISPDVATCGACLAELFDPADRRFRHPFIHCTHCGPRFTIVRGIPFDRARTTMAAFPPCDACAREFADPASRRFHAQAICCPRCGPRLRCVDARGAERAGDPIAAAAAALGAGAVLAVKGLGGYHLAALAGREDSVGALRARKRREEKPFAVLAPDLASARTLAHLTEAEEQVLASARRPIVLARRREGARLAASVAPRNDLVGLLLPYTPLHHLLARELGLPLVLTSGNVSEEPIAYQDADALARLAGVADAFLLHDRPIHIRTDDSVVRMHGGRAVPLRRSRGYAPQPLTLPLALSRVVLACGGELKNTFCWGRGRHAFLSHHIGDLENLETLRSFTEGIEHFARLFDVRAEVVAHDLHPDYLSTKHALGLAGVERVGVQHHHAHVAACLVDNGEIGPVIGVAFDGLGYGADGTLWGGEFLAADLLGFERVAFLEPVAMPGGSRAIHEPWRMAASFLAAAYGDAVPELAVAARNRAKWEPVVRIARSGLRSPPTSSAGRLFDAVAALVGIRDAVRFEGQAAIELEQAASRDERSAYPAEIAAARPHRIRSTDWIRAVVEDLRAGVAAEVIAARFHNGLARAIVATCDRIRETHGLEAVALTGGVFQNARLLAAARGGLERAGFRVLVHGRVPPNDGGLSLGQLAVAGARTASGAG